MTLLMPMGGALDERDEAVVLKEFLRRAGGPQARILVFPQASQRKEAGQELTRLFREWGAGEALSLEFRSRSQADEEDNLRAVRRASGIFFGGGAQLRLASLLGGTRLEAELLAAFRSGVIVGGTSAGASILSKTMIALGKSGATPRFGLLHLSPGLGFTDRFIFDQHFRQRDRLGRLTYAVCAHPGVLGIGIDENTAALLVGLDLPSLFGGALFTETIFAWPGVGRLYFNAALKTDYPMVMAILMIEAALIILSSLLVDFLYAILDPRIRLS